MPAKTPDGAAMPFKCGARSTILAEITPPRIYHHRVANSSAPGRGAGGGSGQTRRTGWRPVLATRARARRDLPRRPRAVRCGGDYAGCFWHPTPRIACWRRVCVIWSKKAAVRVRTHLVPSRIKTNAEPRSVPQDCVRSRVRCRRYRAEIDRVWHVWPEMQPSPAHTAASGCEIF